MEKISIILINGLAKVIGYLSYLARCRHLFVLRTIFSFDTLEAQAVVRVTDYFLF